MCIHECRCVTRPCGSRRCYTIQQTKDMNADVARTVCEIAVLKRRLTWCVDALFNRHAILFPQKVNTKGVSPCPPIDPGIVRAGLAPWYPLAAQKCKGTWATHCRPLPTLV